MENRIWDYTGWLKYSNVSNFYLQKYWNQTFVTMLNQLTIDKPRPILVKVPKKFKSFIKTLSFYKNHNIGLGYIVRFYDDDTNIIEVGDDIKLEILNYNYG